MLKAVWATGTLDATVKCRVVFRGSELCFWHISEAPPSASDVRLPATIGQTGAMLHWSDNDPEET